jgi:hypothetical protein
VTNAIFLSTLIHELGHGLGLPHVDAYGYDLYSGPSIMSYNPTHHSSYEDLGGDPGVLIAEDRQGLSLNKDALPLYSFAPGTIVGAHNAVGMLPPYIPTAVGEVSRRTIQITSLSGNAYESLAQRLAHGYVKLNSSRDGFDPQTMWHSEAIATGAWAALTVEFPSAVTLDRIDVYSQHSRSQHIATAARIWAGEAGAEALQGQTNPPAGWSEFSTTFAAASARRWKVELLPGSSGYVVIRGLRFYHSGGEMYPAPTLDSGRVVVDTPQPSILGSSLENIVQNRVRLNSAGVGFDAQTMWHSDAIGTGSWVVVYAGFPTPATLTRLMVYTQYGGLSNMTDRVMVERMRADGGYDIITEVAIGSADATVDFTATTGASWRFSLRAGSSGAVTIRGLRFFNGSQELFRPLIPWPASYYLEDLSTYTGNQTSPW